MQLIGALAVFDRIQGLPGTLAAVLIEDELFPRRQGSFRLTRKSAPFLFHTTWQSDQRCRIPEVVKDLSSNVRSGIDLEGHLRLGLVAA